MEEITNNITHLSVYIKLNDKRGYICAVRKEYFPLVLGVLGSENTFIETTMLEVGKLKDIATTDCNIKK